MQDQVAANGTAEPKLALRDISKISEGILSVFLLVSPHARLIDM